MTSTNSEQSPTFGGDLLPLPPGSTPLTYRGFPFSRSTLIRLAADGRIKIAKIRLTGMRQVRRAILTESLDAFLAGEIANSPE